MFLDSADIRYLLGKDAKDIQHESALFLLKLKEHRRVSQVAIDDVVEHSKRLFHMTIERAEAAVKAKVADAGFDPNLIELDTVFQDISDPFNGLHTSYLQEKYYNEKLGLVVSMNKLFLVNNACQYFFLFL